MQISFSILGAHDGRAPAPEPDARPADATPARSSSACCWLLLCRSNHVVLVEELIDALWWDGPPRTAHKNIQIYVSHLRKLPRCGRPGLACLILHRPSGYQLRPDPSAEVDALQFEEHVPGGPGSPCAVATRANRPASMREALGLWRGPGPRRPAGVTGPARGGQPP